MEEKRIATAYVSGVLTCEGPLAQLEGRDERSEKTLLLKHRTDSYLVQKRAWVEGTGEEGDKGHYETVEGEYMVAGILAPSSNTLRAKVRDLLSLDISLKAGALGPKTLFFMTGGGGGFDEKVSKGATIQLVRSIREKNVVAGLLGGSIGGAIIPGKVVVGIPVLYCRDLVNFLPRGVRGKDGTEIPTDPAALPEAWTFLDRKQYTRHDDFNIPEVADRLNETGKDMLSKEEYSKGEKEEGKKKDVKRQAIYTIEAVAAGAQYWSHFFLRKPLDRELGGFLKALKLFSKDPYIGGHSNKGFGEISLAYDVVVNYVDGSYARGRVLVNTDRAKSFEVREDSDGVVASAMDSYEKWLGSVTAESIDVDNL